MLITKVDIARYADFTVNIPDSKVDFQVRDAGLMDVAPVITRERYAAILSAETKEDLSEENKALWPLLVPFWALCAYKRLFALHGVDVAQAGIVRPRDGQYEHISDKQRGEILGLIRSKVHFYQEELESYMNAMGLVPVPDTCGPLPKKRNFGFVVARKEAPAGKPAPYTRVVEPDPIVTPPPTNNNGTFPYILS